MTDTQTPTPRYPNPGVTEKKPGRKPKAAFDPLAAIQAAAAKEVTTLRAELAVARANETIAHNHVASLEASLKVAEKHAQNGH